MDWIAQFFSRLFRTDGFAAKDVCRQAWPTYLVQMHNFSDLAIWAAYLAIPVVLFFFARKRETLPFRHLFGLFGLFILSCGFTHFMEFFTFTTPMYRLAGLIKLVTAIASWGTVIALIPAAPRALAMKSPEELERIILERTRELESTNEQLQHEVDERTRVEHLLLEERAHIREMNLELERRVAERTAELEISNRELESFAYSVAHDLRAPLRAVDGFSQVIVTDYARSLDPEIFELLGRIRAASHRMDELISSLLKLSRVARQEISREPLDLTKMAGELLSELAQAEPERKVSYEVQPGMTVEADYNLTRALLSNLLSNAWKFTSQVKAARIVVGQGDDGVVYVQDNGAGFDMQYADKLFSPFERLHTEREFPGTGIGLATVERVIQKHGGAIWAESAPNEGAKFSFSLRPRLP